MRTGEGKNLVFGEAFDYCFAQLNSKIETTGIVINTKNITTVIKLAMEIVEATALKEMTKKTC